MSDEAGEARLPEKRTAARHSYAAVTQASLGDPINPSPSTIHDITISSSTVALGNLGSSLYDITLPNTNIALGSFVPSIYGTVVPGLGTASGSVGPSVYGTTVPGLGIASGSVGPSVYGTTVPGLGIASGSIYSMTVPGLNITSGAPWPSVYGTTATVPDIDVAMWDKVLCKPTSGATNAAWAVYNELLLLMRTAHGKASRELARRIALLGDIALRSEHFVRNARSLVLGLRGVMLKSLRLPVQFWQRRTSNPVKHSRADDSEGDLRTLKASDSPRGRRVVLWPRAF